VREVGESAAFVVGIKVIKEEDDGGDVADDEVRANRAFMFR
jgi:hypothetical protein|tara:strand:- start:285 stop:407 length:123 start_codon:yes stop_codon:yes gene_type:complete